VLSASGNPSGVIGFSDMPELLEHADHFTSAGSLNLAEVQQMDSAGLSLLLELTRRAKKRSQELKLTGANAQIRDIARFFGLDSILHFAD
jgi:phospholipid transport system transporter-binding protein